MYNLLICNLIIIYLLIVLNFLKFYISFLKILKRKEDILVIWIKIYVRFYIYVYSVIKKLIEYINGFGFNNFKVWFSI